MIDRATMRLLEAIKDYREQHARDPGTEADDLLKELGEIEGRVRGDAPDQAVASPGHRAANAAASEAPAEEKAETAAQEKAEDTPRTFAQASSAAREQMATTR